MQSQTREAREEDTYLKTPFRGKTPAASFATLDSYAFHSESSFPAMEMDYNEVKMDINTSPYNSGQEEPHYVHFQQKPDTPGNQGTMDVGNIIKQLAADSKEKSSDSGNVINIGNITIYNNTPDSQYYGTWPRHPPDPCLPNHYDYPSQQRDFPRTPTTPEEDIYIGLTEKTPVEHFQSSVPHDHNINPYRETRNFLPNSRSASNRMQGTQSEQREAESGKSQGTENSPAQITIQPRKSSDGPPNVFDVQLTLKDSRQRWIGELRPSPPSESNPVPLSMLDLSENTYDSHTKSPDRQHPTISHVIDPLRTSPPTERLPETDNKKGQEITNHNDDIRMTLSDEHTFLKLPQSVEGEARGDTKQIVSPVENPVYMTGSIYRATRMNRQEGSSIEMDPFNGGLNLHKGWLMSQSAPDMRHVVPTQTRLSFSRKWNSRNHQCEVDGFFSVHDERAIEEAKAMLESRGEDRNWLVTSAVRQPMQSYYLHVRLLGKTNSFPINRVKGKKIAIDTSSNTSFACLCKLIKHYTLKKNLPNQDKKLGNAFKMSASFVTHL